MNHSVNSRSTIKRAHPPIADVCHTCWYIPCVSARTPHYGSHPVFEKVVFIADVDDVEYNVLKAYMDVKWINFQQNV